MKTLTLSPVVITHYNCFVKIDSWYHVPDEVRPSTWLKGVEVLYDPESLISGIIEESNSLVYELSADEWRSGNPRHSLLFKKPTELS